MFFANCIGQQLSSIVALGERLRGVSWAKWENGFAPSRPRLGQLLGSWAAVSCYDSGLRAGFAESLAPILNHPLTQFSSVNRPPRGLPKSITLRHPYPPTLFLPAFLSCLKVLQQRFMLKPSASFHHYHQYPTPETTMYLL